MFWWRAKIAGAEAAGEERLVRPVAAEFAAHEKALGELVFRGQRCFLQHLVDAAEQPFVVEPLVANAKGDWRRQLISRVGAEPCSDSDGSSLLTSLVT